MRPVSAKPCTYPHCRNFATLRGRCDVHVRQENAKYDRERNSIDPERKFIRSSQWHKIRLEKLARNPLCERCEKEYKRIRRAMLVHHIDENEFNNNWENLESNCNECHEEYHGSSRFVSRR